MTASTISPGSPGAAAALSEVVATLPESYRLVREPVRAAVVVVNGAPGWVGESMAAIRCGARAVVVVDPGPVRASEVELLALAADRRGAMVELAEGYAGDPGIAAHSRDLGSHLSAAGAVYLTEITPTLSRSSATLGTLRTLRALGQPAAISAVWETLGTILMRGSAGGRPLSAAVSRSTVPPRQRVQAVGVLQTVDVVLHGRATARPAEMTVSMGIGALRLPTVYEGALRATLRHVRAAMLSESHDGATLWSFIEDLTEAERPRSGRSPR